MSIIRLDNRGQISAEYLLLFVVILTVFLFMINNFIGPTIDASNSVSKASDAKIAIESIADAVNIVYANGPGAKRTIDINIPQDLDLNFNTDSQIVETTINNLNYNGNPANSKTLNAKINIAANIDISPSTLPLSKGWHTVQVYWNTTTNNITITA
ncbi:MULTISPECIES: class III signal peptide-containing protein [Methanobacterium]|uniref:Class III signal peptide-containing protein n=1 Tax=Methanobacterium bryantii TaxID=2161 RepID=A0A2A2H857_METBR|nr:MULTISPECIES: class III signal peptide-containing protein [Methanobacterium]OEC84883.1 hypothetical protein A9507_14580 [Methanobacterium sp. A39]PAV05525.1 hypothetical protein ASJ80_09115 [Methanobacterium bryantii]